MRKRFFLSAIIEKLYFVSLIYFFFLQGLFANVLEIQEKYLPDQSSGDFTAGRVGRAVGIWTQQPLVYPVLFNRKIVTEGTISLWFRPAKRYIDEYDIQRFFSMSDGIKTVSFILNGEGNPFPKRRLYFPGGHFDDIGEKESTIFNHILYTWKNDTAAFYFNGKPVEFGGRTADSVLPLDGSKTFLYLSAEHVIWFDEILILGRYMLPEEAIEMYKTPSSWDVDEHTAFYAGFENTLSAAGYVCSNGDLVRMISRVGRIDGTFGANDKLEFNFTVVNMGSSKQRLLLKGVIKDLDKQTILEKKYSVTVAGGKYEIIRFDMSDINKNGLFWGYFTLLKDATEIDSEVIPFAKTLMVNKPRHTGEEITTGLVVNNGFSPDYVQWSLLYSEYWKNHEISPGEFYFDRIDFKVDNLVRTGRNPVFMISSPPQWFIDKYKNTATLDGYYYPDTDEKEAMDIWKRYVRTVGERYKGKIFDYEVYGEAYFRSDARHYGRLVNITKEVLAEVDPKIRVACNMGGSHTWAKTVAEITAGKADYYTIHPYIWVNGATHTLKDEKYAYDYISLLREAKANAELANTEYGAFTFLSLGIDKDGYPITKNEFEKSGLWDTWAPSLKARGRDAFVDWHTAAFRAVRGVTLNKVIGCKYEMWWTSSRGGGIADLKFKAHTPSPASVAYANASAIFSGYSYVQRIALGGVDTIKAYLFSKDGRYMLVAFNDDDHYDRMSTVYLELEGREIEVLDVYGNNLPVEFFGNIARLDFSVNSVFYIRGLSKIPKLSRPVVIAEVLDRDVFAGRKSKVKVTLYNPLNEKVEGKVWLSLPPSFENVVPQSVTIMQKESRELIFEINIPVGIQDPQVFYTIFDTGTKTLKTIFYRAVLPVRTSFIADYTVTAPVIDGDLKEWGDIQKFPITIKKPDQVVLGTPYTESYIPRIDWKGPDDLSAVAYVKYDQSNLYFAIRVYDDIVMNPYGWTPALANMGDCIELFINGSPMEKQMVDTYTDDVFQVFFAPAVEKFPVPFYFIARPEQKRLPRRPLAGMVFASQRTPDGYTIEIKIPLYNFRFKSSDLTAGNSIGFDIAVNDRDEETEKRKGRSRIIWSGKKESDINPLYFGRILFGDK